MTLTAVLFAGGESRRMGRDKATLMLAGQSLWARQLDVLREVGPKAIWISARQRPVWCPLEIEVILDEPPARGPLGGLAATLAVLRTTHLLALAIDLPRMTSSYLRDLWSQASPGCGIIPQNSDYLEPLCAIYPAAASTIAAATLSSPDVSLQKLARSLLQENLVRVQTVSAAERPLFHNVNTPAEM